MHNKDNRDMSNKNVFYPPREIVIQEMKKKAGKMSHDFVPYFSATKASFALSKNAKLLIFQIITKQSI